MRPPGKTERHGAARTRGGRRRARFFGRSRPARGSNCGSVFPGTRGAAARYAASASGSKQMGVRRANVRQGALLPAAAAIRTQRGRGWPVANWQQNAWATLTAIARDGLRLRRAAARLLRFRKPCDALDSLGTCFGSKVPSPPEPGRSRRALLGRLHRRSQRRVLLLKPRRRLRLREATELDEFLQRMEQEGATSVLFPSVPPDAATSSGARVPFQQAE